MELDSSGTFVQPGMLAPELSRTVSLALEKLDPAGEVSVNERHSRMAVSPGLMLQAILGITGDPAKDSRLGASDVQAG